MIQRKQTFFLALAVVLGIVCVFMQSYPWWMHALLLVATAVNVYVITDFKQRMRQARVCLVSILVYVMWYVGLIVYSKQIAPDAADFQVTIADAFPAVCIVLTFMARMAIIADEKWLKKMDRIR